MNLINDYDAAIFDLDGTLIDSMPLWKNFCSHWLLSIGKTPEAALEDDILSMTIGQSADYINRRYALNISREGLLKAWEGVMTPRYLQGAVLKKGAAELVKRLSEKMKLGIATYSFPGSCRAVLEQHKILSYFSSFIFAHEFEDKSKNASVKKDPEFWIEAARRLETEPAKCVVFEDSWSSLEGIRGAGMGIVAVFDQSSTKWPLLSKAADLAVNYPGEALNYGS